MQNLTSVPSISVAQTHIPNFRSLFLVLLHHIHHPPLPWISSLSFQRGSAATMAEKFSKFRDPGTGIQVFLTPVAASTSSSSSLSPSSLGPVGLILTPIFVLLGLIRALIGGLFWALYLVSGSAGLLRIVLWTFGFISLPVHTLSLGASGRKTKSAVAGQSSVVAVKKGDLVLANHSSWIDLLILSYLHPGVKFVVPVIADSDRQQAQPAKQAGQASRRTAKKNAMSANTRMVAPTSPLTLSSATVEIAILGYAVLPLTSAISFVGHLPPSTSQISSTIHPDLESVLKSSSTPLVVFPEVVTSNNRALLTCSLPSTSPPSAKTCVVTTIKYSPASPTSTTSVYSVPTSKLSHLFNILLLSLPYRSVAVRQAVLPRQSAEDWSEQVAGIMSTIARLKRTGLGWGSKKEFLCIANAQSKSS